MGVGVGAILQRQTHTEVEQQRLFSLHTKTSVSDGFIHRNVEPPHPSLPQKNFTVVCERIFEYLISFPA